MATNTKHHPVIRVAGKAVSRSEIARKSGLSRSYLSYVFSGKRQPSLAAAVKIAKALGVTVEQLHKGLPKPVEEKRSDWPGHDESPAPASPSL